MCGTVFFTGVNVRLLGNQNSEAVYEIITEPHIYSLDPECEMNALYSAVKKKVQH